MEGEDEEGLLYERGRERGEAEEVGEGEGTPVEQERGDFL